MQLILILFTQSGPKKRDEDYYRPNKLHDYFEQKAVIVFFYRRLKLFKQSDSEKRDEDFYRFD